MRDCVSRGAGSIPVIYPITVMKLSAQKNTKAQGNAGLGSAIAYATEKGYIVSVPLNDSQCYDLIFDVGDTLKKVQVKTTTLVSPYGVYRVELRQTGGNQSFHTSKPFDAEQIDYLFVLCENGDRFFIPSSSLTSTTSINLGKKYDEFKL